MDIPNTSSSVMKDGEKINEHGKVVDDIDDEKLKAPYVGLFFHSIDDAKSYYEEYGRQNGFCVRRRSSNKTKIGVDEVTSVKFVCSREGKHIKKAGNNGNDIPSRSCSTVKRECQACMRILYNEKFLKWSVSVFSDDHNHKFVTPIKRMHMRCNRHMPEAAKDLTEKFNRENIPVSKVRSLLEGSNIGFDERDCYNYLRTSRLQNLKEGDASSVLTYFQRRLRENPQFFYNVQVDIVSGRAVNFFWVDTRSRMAYEHFGDVVTFDTTYKTNAYSMPFAPFTGVNHHFQTIQFGCALLQDETEVSFLWLFTTWLEAMGGRAPKSIITDQGAAMCAAVKKIFPFTRHRLCLWHIKMKFPEKLSHVYHENSKFKADFEKCLQFTYKVEDFENLWKNIMQEYKLENNVWLQGLYDIRDSWVPVYHRTTFYAGMNTTGRSEGINAFFDDFVRADTNLKDFVEKYEKALEKLVRNEIDEDYLSEHKDRIVHERDLLLKHAGDVYTRNIFKKFSSELFKANNFKASELARDGVCDTYLVTNKFCTVEKFIVTWNKETSEGSCECNHFHFTGLLCRHLLKIFDRLDVDQIPQHFILRRWTKGANNFRIIDEQAVQSSHDCSATFRLSHLCRKTTQLSCIASENSDLYKKALEGIDRVMKDVLEERDRIAAISTEASSEAPTTQDVVSPVCPVLILDPHVSQTVGRKQKEDDKKKRKENNIRWKRPIEVALKKRRRNCSICKSPDHDKRSCPNNPNRQPKTQCEPSIDNGQGVRCGDAGLLHLSGL